MRVVIYSFLHHRCVPCVVNEEVYIAHLLAWVQNLLSLLNTTESHLTLQANILWHQWRCTQCCSLAQDTHAYHVAANKYFQQSMMTLLEIYLLWSMLGILYSLSLLPLKYFSLGKCKCCMFVQNLVYRYSYVHLTTVANI